MPSSQNFGQPVFRKRNCFAPLATPRQRARTSLPLKLSHVVRSALLSHKLRCSHQFKLSLVAALQKLRRAQVVSSWTDPCEPRFSRGAVRLTHIQFLDGRLTLAAIWGGGALLNLCYRVAAGIVGAPAFGWVPNRRGFSARDHPSALEVCLATTARRRSIPASGRNTRDPFAPTLNVLSERAPTSQAIARWSNTSHCRLAHPR
jgi:hypothetical protein